MKIVLDDIIFYLQRGGGISRYFKEISLIPHSGVCRGSIFSHLLSLKVFARISCLFPVLLNSPAVFHSSYYRRPFSSSVKCVVTVHDFNHELGYVSGFFSYGFVKFVKHPAIRRADHIICISESTKADLRRFFPDLTTPVDVIYNGLSDIFVKHPKLDRDISNKIMFVGSRAEYKNFYNSVCALALLKDKHFIIVGGGPLSNEETSLLNSRLAGRYSHFSDICDEQLKLIYQSVDMLLYPSSYEGFGIPIIEAFSQGTQVIILNTPACVEVAGGHAVVAESEDPLSLLDAIQDSYSRFHIINRDALVSRAMSFSWHQTREKTNYIYKALSKNT